MFCYKMKLGGLNPFNLGSLSTVVGYENLRSRRDWVKSLQHQKKVSYQVFKTLDRMRFIMKRFSKCYPQSEFLPRLFFFDVESDKNTFLILTGNQKAH